MLNNLAESTSPLLKIVPDFQVSPNRDNYFHFDEPSITYLADGGFVIVYKKDFFGGSKDIYGQRYNSDGTTQGQAFLVNANPVSRDSSLQIATLKNGDFVVTWVFEYADTSYILGQRFKTDGTKIGSEFRVSTQNQSRDQLIASLSNGGFVVIWVNQDSDNSTYNIYGQRYDADGVKVGQAFQINTNTYLNPTQASVAALADGGFLFTWQEQYYSLYGQRYDANGVKVGQAFQIGDNSDYSSSFVTSLADGRYLITWSNESDSSSVYYGQLYNLDGSLSGDTFVFNLDIPVTESDNDISSITALPNGGFLVNTYDLYTQEYDANANRVGQAVQINSDRGYPDNLSVTSLTNGGYAAVWVSSNINAAIFGAGDAGSIAFSQTSYSVGEDGTPVTVITLIRTGGSDGDVSVTLTPSDGTATASDDYDNNAIVVSFNIGETSKTVTIPLVNDNLIEADETINLTLSNPTGNVTLGSETNATLTYQKNHLLGQEQNYYFLLIPIAWSSLTYQLHL